MTSLKIRIKNDRAFFQHMFTEVPASEVLALVKEKYPQALYYDAIRKRITFSAPTDGWFRWLDYNEGELKYTCIYAPGKEDDE